jgi:hypothetical protein
MDVLFWIVVSPIIALVIVAACVVAVLLVWAWVTCWIVACGFIPGPIGRWARKQLE